MPESGMQVPLAAIVACNLARPVLPLGMLTQTATAHFGNNTKTAAALGISRQAVDQWGKYVPLMTALRLEKITKGALKVDLQKYMSAA